MNPDPSLSQLSFDRFELDEGDARLTCDGAPVELAPKPFAVLCELARTPQRLVPTKNALLETQSGDIASSPSRCSSRRSASCVRHAR